MVKGVRTLDITGEVYGQLTAISNTWEKNNNGSYIWNFECSCGNTLKREIGNIRFRPESATCTGCFRKKMAVHKTTHGTPKNDKVYISWRKIKERCFNPNDPCYPRYGAVGLTLCDEWKDNFPAFRDHIGQPPKDGKRYTVDRIDNSLGYVPDNIRWATGEQQSRNKGKQLNNTSGASGVNWEDKMWPCGKNFTRYAVAQWKGLDRRNNKKCFSAKKYGEELAFFMACEYREQQINLLNLQGAGYTEGHGKVKSITGATV